MAQPSTETGVSNRQGQGGGQICSTSVDFMERGSAYHVVTCSACAEVCRACARACRQIGGDAMVRCAQTCDACAESCEQMAQHVRAAATGH